MVSYPEKYRERKEYYVIYAELVAAARHKGLVSYQDIAKLIGLPLTGNFMSHEIGSYLGSISENEAQYSRPMLSAIAVSTTGKPGPGFFKLARNLRKLSGNTREEKEAFWHREIAEVYKTWKTVFSK